MQTAVNAPFPHMDLNVGSMNFGLAHEAQRDETYRDFLRSYPDKFLILDNAADELGEGMKGQPLWDLILDIQPDEMILPDVLENTEKTLENSNAFLKEFQPKKEFPEMSIMAVAQGENWSEWLLCYKEWYYNDQVDVIGIPYDIDFSVKSSRFNPPSRTLTRATNRLTLIQELEDRDLLGKEVHLLGMNNLWELRTHELMGLPAIRSNDTTAPFAAAQVSRKWETGDSGEKDWPAMDFDLKFTETEKEMAVHNLLEYFSACGDTRAAYQLGKANR